ncbi:midasin [Pygocentrus nattereri]|uniref:midasin n=1 Tax=Pygocentrus nattereri TaxID=42514 RepID=UPI000814A033|nr:midasin [Pygocentrus nattereri]
MNVSWLELQSQRMDPRTDVQSGQRYQHISRAVWLQSRWQEVSERERRAQLHNRKLLQDFQRAQETLSDLVARTEAMNTIRVEYERYLEENFPRWQQKLKDKRLSEQRKRIEEHLKACIQQMEEDQRMEWGNNSPVRTNSSSCISSDLSHPPIPHPDHRDMRREVHAGMPRSTSSQQNNKQNIQGNVHNGFQHFSFPFTWLMQPSVSEPQQSDIPKETKTFQNTHQAFNSPGDPRYGPYPIVRQESPYNDHLRPYPKAWAGGVQCDPAGALWSVLPFVNPLVWRMGLSDSTAEGMQCSEEAEGEKQKKSSSGPQVEKHQAKKQRRKLNGGDQSSELDTKSVHLSSNNGDSSESRALSCDAVTSFASGMQKRKKERRREKQTHKPTVEKETVSWSSSSMSNVHSGMNNEKDMSSLSSPVRRPFKNHKVSKAKVKSTAGVESPEHPGEESEQEGKRNQETLKSSGSEVEKKKKKKRNEYNKKDHMEQMDHKDQEEVSAGVEGCLSEDRGSKGGEEEERAGTGHTAQDEEEWTEGLHVKKNDSGDRDEDETDGGVEDKALSNNASEGGSVSEKLVNYVGESGVDDEEEEENKDGGGEEEEDGEKEEDKDGDKEEEEEDLGEEESKDGGDDDEKDEDEKEEEAEEISVEVGAPRGSKGGDDESDEEVNDSEVAASGSGSNMYDSLKELYKDEETEDEELYDQEIEDDTEDDDDDVVVEKAHPWSHDPTYDHTKYQDDDYDDDVEGLLAPQDNVQQHQADEAEETVKPTDLHSDSEEDGSQRKAPLAPVKDEPVDSDDEFDHFYD